MLSALEEQNFLFQLQLQDKAEEESSEVRSTDALYSHRFSYFFLVQLSWELIITLPWGDRLFSHDNSFIYLINLKIANFSILS